MKPKKTETLSINAPEKQNTRHISLEKWKLSQSSHKCKALFLVGAHYSGELPRNLKWAPLTATSWKPFGVKNNNRWKKRMQGHVDLYKLTGSFFIPTYLYMNWLWLLPVYTGSLHWFHSMTFSCRNLRLVFEFQSCFICVQTEKQVRAWIEKAFRPKMFVFPWTTDELCHVATSVAKFMDAHCVPCNA